MAHSCPDCYQMCYCGGDIDDCCFDGTPEELACGHCLGRDDDDDDGYDDEPEGIGMPCNGTFACPCRQCVRDFGP
jgi:hypothetical protein